MVSNPSLVGAATNGIADSNLTIFNGAEGVSQIIAGLVGQGLSILDTFKRSTAAAGRKDAETVFPAEGAEHVLKAAAAEPVPKANAAKRALRAEVDEAPSGNSSAVSAQAPKS